MNVTKFLHLSNLVVYFFIGISLLAHIYLKICISSVLSRSIPILESNISLFTVEFIQLNVSVYFCLMSFTVLPSNTPNVRRTMRTRSKPLEYWRGERINYQGRPSGKICILVSQNKK